MRSQRRRMKRGCGFCRIESGGSEQRKRGCRKYKSWSCWMRKQNGLFWRKRSGEVEERPEVGMVEIMETIRIKSGLPFNVNFSPP
jgi:hypothetical protein